uniref:Uncharacterized protein n=1 Tax=Oryza sativa subsp. japonica TaxID=39947 RepID=Q94LD5_ORYSJ|nr:hypothetical protein [Oryza sativa Japonica Group]
MRQAEDGGTQGAEPVGGGKGGPRAAVVGDGGEGQSGARWAASSKLMVAWLRAGGWRNLAQSRHTVWEPHEPVSAIARSRASLSSSFYRAALSRAPPPHHHRRNRHCLLVVMDRAITARRCPPHVPMLLYPSLVPALRPPVFPRPSPCATAHRLYATTCPRGTPKRESDEQRQSTAAGVRLVLGLRRETTQPLAHLLYVGVTDGELPSSARVEAIRVAEGEAAGRCRGGRAALGAEGGWRQSGCEAGAEDSDQWAGAVAEAIGAVEGEPRAAVDGGGGGGNSGLPARGSSSASATRCMHPLACLLHGI